MIINIASVHTNFIVGFNIMYMHFWRIHTMMVIRYEFVYFATNFYFAYAIQPKRIKCIPRIITHIRIQVHTPLEADGVGLDEAAEMGAVVSIAIVIQPGFGVKPPAGEHIWVADRAGLERLPVSVVAVSFHEAAGGIGQADDRAQV